MANTIPSQILAALATAGEPLSVRALYEASDLAESTTSIACACRDLMSSGKIVRGGTTGKFVYSLASDVRETRTSTAPTPANAPTSAAANEKIVEDLAAKMRSIEETSSAADAVHSPQHTDAIAQADSLHRQKLKAIVSPPVDLDPAVGAEPDNDAPMDEVLGELAGQLVVDLKRRKYSPQLAAAVIVEWPDTHEMPRELLAAVRKSLTGIGRRA